MSNQTPMTRPGYGAGFVRDDSASPVQGAASAGDVCATCGGSKVDPGGLPICRACGANEAGNGETCGVCWWAAASATTDQGAAVKPWEERYKAASWPPIYTERMAMEDEITEWRLRGAAFAERAQAAQPSGAVPDTINGPLTDAQRSRAHELMRNFRHLGADGDEDVIRAIAVMGYTNGVRDMRDEAATPAPEQEAAPQLGEALATFLAENTRLNQDGIDTHAMKMVLALNYAALNPVPESDIEEWREQGYIAAPVEQEAAQTACTYPSCACVGGGVFKPCIKSGEYREAAQVAPLGAQEAVAWAVTAPRGGIHKLSITRDSAERKAAKWREEWPDNGCSVRPLVFGDTAPVPATTPAEQPESLEPVTGDVLPAIGSKVLIHLARQDEWVEHTVVGYYAWPALSCQVVEGEQSSLHRVFVRVVDSNGYDNARLLSECRATATNTNQPEGDQKCWSCKREYTDEQRTQADGDCPHCGVEIEILGAANTNKGGEA